MISSTYIRDYLMGKFAHNSKIVSGDTELLIPSIFLENDWKMHMSINLDTGLFQCFKSKERGNFIKLYAKIEGVSYKKAKEDLNYYSFFQDETPVEPKEQAPNPPHLELGSLEEIPLDYATSQEPTELGLRAWTYIFGRRLYSPEDASQRYFVCSDGKFKNRLIIPFYVGDTMVFFQARALLEDQYPKYLNPSEIKASEILVPFDEDRPWLFVTEGPFDMISLRLAGLNATCTFGSVVSEFQADILKAYPGNLVLAYDSDSAGEQGIRRFENLRLRKRMGPFFIVSPPDKKDWNNLWSSEGKDILKYTVPTSYDFKEQIRRIIV